MEGRRIGVMGGTFDPIHVGHLAAANEAAVRLSLDEVVFVPTGRPWQKSGTEISSAEDRYLMTVLATATNPRFEVSRVDIDRPGPTYTVDTLQDLRSAYGPASEFFCIVGADTLESMLSWRDAEKVLTMATFVAVNRPGYDASAEHLNGLAVVRPIEIPQVGISSSECRARVAAGLPIRYLVPDNVVRYIQQRGLYRPAQHASTEPSDREVSAGRDRLDTSIPSNRRRKSVVATDTAKNLALTAAQAAADKLARDIVLLDVSDQLVITDVFMIASAPSERQVMAIVDAVEDGLRTKYGEKPVRREGQKSGHWVLLDYAELVVHVQHTEDREFYALDSLWKDCPVIPFTDATAGAVNDADGAA